MEKELQQVVNTAMASPYRVVRVPFQDAHVWVKKAVGGKSNFWHGMQNILSRLVPLDVLKPSVSTGGAAALYAEASRIAEFSAAGFHVPQVLLVSDDCLVLEDIGMVIDTELKTTSDMTSEKIIATAKECAREIARSHKVGLAHGRCKLNDLVRLGNGGIGFIDFEENTKTMPLPVQQARELWLFSASLARYHVQAPYAVQGAIQAYRGVYSAKEVFDEMSRLLRFLKPFVLLLKPFRAFLKGDAARAYTATSELLRLAEKGFDV